MTRRRGIAANSSGKRSATSASSNANSTSGAGSVTTSRPEGSGSSSWSHSLSKARTFTRRFAPPPYQRGGVLGRFGLRLVRRCGFERVLEHVLYPAGEVERHRFAHALRHVVDVL